MLAGLSSLGAHRAALAVLGCRHDLLLLAHSGEAPHVGAEIALVCPKLACGSHNFRLNLDIGVDAICTAVALILLCGEARWAPRPCAIFTTAVSKASCSLYILLAY